MILVCYICARAVYVWMWHDSVYVCVWITRCTAWFSTCHSLLPTLSTELCTGLHSKKLTHCSFTAAEPRITQTKMEGVDLLRSQNQHELTKKNESNYFLKSWADKYWTCPCLLCYWVWQRWLNLHVLRMVSTYKQVPWHHLDRIKYIKGL